MYRNENRRDAPNCVSTAERDSKPAIYDKKPADTITYRIKLMKEEVLHLQKIVNKGWRSTRTYKIARILLNADEGQYRSDEIKNERICKALNINMRTVDEIKKKMVEGGLEAALSPLSPFASDCTYGRTLDDRAETKPTTLCCSEPPAGLGRWSFRLLACFAKCSLRLFTDKTLVLRYVDGISHSGEKKMKKNAIMPPDAGSWVIPPEQNAKFVAHMERILDVYKRPYDKDFPVVCMDESSEQLIETLSREAMKAGKSRRADYEYIRHGAVSVFMANEPLKGRRLTEIAELKTQSGRVKFIRRIADEMCPHAKKITLISDRFDTRSIGAFYEAFPPEEARRLIDRFEFVSTPKHGGWLNTAKMELHLLSRQCLSRSMATMEEMEQEVLLWQENRNSKNATIHWQFSTKDARVKLKCLYPQ
jgi:hypothetical protein